MNTYIQRIITMVFCLLICLPLAGTLLRVGTLTSSEFRKEERRQRENFPRVSMVGSVNEWTGQFGKWFDDRYAFRQYLVKSHALLQYRLFNLSAFPDLVVTGKNDFLFLGNRYSRSLDVHAGIPVWSAEDLASVSEDIRTATEWMHTQDIPLLISVPPDKATIYGEYLPDWIPAPNFNLPVARLCDLATARGQTNFHYNPEVLLDAKNQYPDVELYFAGDSHWNAVGAFVYYKDILHMLETVYGKRLRVLPEVALSSTTSYSIFDLENFLKDKRLRKNVTLDTRVWPPLPERLNLKSEVLAHTPGEFADFVTNNSQALNQQKILIVGDSFFLSMGAYIYRTFTSTMYIHVNSSPEVLAEAVKWFDPDIVLLEIVERAVLDRFTQIGKNVRKNAHR